MFDTINIIDNEATLDTGWSVGEHVVNITPNETYCSEPNVWKVLVRTFSGGYAFVYCRHLNIERPTVDACIGIKSKKIQL